MPLPVPITRSLRPARAGLVIRLGMGLKAAYSVAFGSGLSPLGSFLYGLLPGSRYNWEKEVGPAWANSAVSIGLSWVADNFSEPTLRVVTTDAQGEDQPVESHPLLGLLDQPNPFDDADSLFTATLISYLVDGNAYWVKSRGMGGQVVALWYVPHWAMKIDWDDRGLPAQYIYTARGRTMNYALEDVVHFKFGKDPENPFYGLSRLRPLLREIYTDNQRATYEASLLRNYGVPGVILSPEDPTVTMDKEDRDSLKELWRASTTGDNVGMPIVPSAAVKVQQMAFSPDQLALGTIGEGAEARICSALRISPMCLDLKVGLENSTYSNKQEARKGAYLDCLIPMQKRFAKTIDKQLLPDVGGYRTERVKWDYAGVEALAENQDDLATRAVALFTGGVFMRSESRQMMGKDSKPADDVYASDIAMEQAKQTADLAGRNNPQQTTKPPKSTKAALLDEEDDDGD